MGRSETFSEFLRDPRLALHATAAAPAWLWSLDATRILWANATAAAVFGADDPATLAARRFDRSHPASAQVARLAAMLPPGAPPRLERLRGLASLGRALTCACSRIALADDREQAVLVVSVERPAPALQIGERVRRLLAGNDARAAAFTSDGTLIHAVPSASEHLAGATTLDGLGIAALGTAALSDGHATGRTRSGAVTIDRLGSGAAAVLLVTFGTPGTGAEPKRPEPRTPASAPAPNPVPATSAPAHSTPSTERRHPLRFVWRTDTEQRFAIESDEFVAMLGPRTGSALGRPWGDLAAELDLDPEGRIARALASHETWSNVTLPWPVDGSAERVAVELSGLPMFDRERRFTGYRGFGVCRDVACVVALARTRETAVAPPIEASTPAAAQPATAPGAPEPPTLSPVEHRAFREIARQLTERLGEAGEGGIAEAAELRATPEPALLRAETEVRELRSILDTATDGVVTIEHDGRIVACNRSAEALFGWESGELAGRPFAELFAPESQRAAADYLDGLQRTGVASLLNDGREVIGRVRQGGLIPLFMTMGRIADGTQKFCAVFRDITQWKKAEEELVNARRLAEKASSAKSEFLAKISHEIRTPLNAIIGFSEVMMSERFGAIGNERYREYLKDIHTSGAHLVSLINDLLDLSKIEAGKLDLTFTRVSLNELTQQCVALMQPQANRERIIIRTSLAPALPHVVADARSVRQMVLNLLSNSIKFTGAGGQVIVSTALSDAGEAVLRVRDTGIGMSEMDVATALEPFRQLPTSARWGSGGTGLGLPLTKALAEANRASFSITSAPSAGTLVEISFPATRVLAE
jgi:PAS domain S-box-containing protein